MTESKTKAMTGAQKMRAYRERMRALGYTQKVVWCTDEEHKHLLEALRSFRDLKGQIFLDLND